MNIKKRFTALMLAGAMTISITATPVFAEDFFVDKVGPEYSGEVVMTQNLYGGIDSQESGAREFDTGLPQSKLPQPANTLQNEEDIVCGSQFEEQIVLDSLPNLVSTYAQEGIKVWALGDTKEFVSKNYSGDGEKKSFTAEVAYVTEKCTIWRDVANRDTLSDAKAKELGDEITRTYDLMVNSFGNSLSMDTDGDQKTAFVFYPMALDGATDITLCGYFSPADILPKYVPELAELANGNNMDMLNINTNPKVLESAMGTVLHEFQHLINFSNTLGHSDTWINETFSQSAAVIAGIVDDTLNGQMDKLMKYVKTHGYTSPFVFKKIYVPNTGDEVVPAYGQWYLFGRYLAYQTKGLPGGGNGIFKTILKPDATSGLGKCQIDTLENTLTAIGYMGEGKTVKDFNEMLTNYNIALYKRDASGIYSLSGNAGDPSNVDGITIPKIEPMDLGVPTIKASGAASFSKINGSVTPTTNSPHVSFAGLGNKKPAEAEDFVDTDGPDYSGKAIMMQNMNVIGSPEQLLHKDSTGFPAPKAASADFNDKNLNIKSRCGTPYIEKIDMSKLRDVPATYAEPEKKVWKIGDTKEVFTDQYYDEKAGKFTAKLLYATTHCTIWGDSSDETALTEEQAKTLGDDVEKRYNTMLAAYGSPEKCDVDNDGKVAFMFYKMIGGADGAMGFFDTSDLFTKEEIPEATGTHMDMLHLNADCIKTPSGFEYAKGTIIHELQHLINFAETGGTYDMWLNEAFSQSAIAVVGLSDDNSLSEVTMVFQLFNSLGSTYPFVFNEDYIPRDETSGLPYASWYVFGRYLAHQTKGLAGGGDEIYKTVLSYKNEKGNAACTTQRLTDTLKEMGYMGEDKAVKSFDQLVKNFNIALYRREKSGIYSLTMDPANPSVLDKVTVPTITPTRTPISEILGGGAASFSLINETATPTGFGAHVSFAGLGTKTPPVVDPPVSSSDASSAASSTSSTSSASSTTSAASSAANMSTQPTSALTANKVNNVQTADNTPIGLIVFLAVSSLAVLAIVSRKKG